MFCDVEKIPHTMAKRGRKPKERKGYFYETEEDAIVQYINEEDADHCHARQNHGRGDEENYIDPGAEEIALCLLYPSAGKHQQDACHYKEEIGERRKKRHYTGRRP